MEHEQNAINCAELHEVSSEKNGAKIIFATDDYFGVAENLLKEEEPVWKEGEYTEFGKCVDGWETRRKRKTGHDYAIIALAAEAQISHICIDTCFFTGNFPLEFSISGIKLTPNLTGEDTCFTGDYPFDFPISSIKLTSNLTSGGNSMWRQNRDQKLGTEATEDDYQNISVLYSENWSTLISKQKLEAGYPDMRKKFFKISTSKNFTHLRLNIFPDGGIARLRIYGTVINSNAPLKEIDLISKINGGACVDFSNAHYGHPNNLIKSGKATNVADGWETARHRNRHLVVDIMDTKMSVSEWAIFKLAHSGDIKITEVIADTTHYTGNAPYSIKVEGTYTSIPDTIPLKSQWKDIVQYAVLRPNSENQLSTKNNWGKLSHIRVTIMPDGGLSRLRVFGKLRRIRTDIAASTSNQSSNS